VGRVKDTGGISTEAMSELAVSWGRHVFNEIYFIHFIIEGIIIS
jgi:hypothetical protein